MKLPFNTLSAEAKLWTYLANRKLNTQEEAHLNDSLGDFLKNWESHDKPLSAGYLWENPLLIIGVETSQHKPSGCALDKLERALKNFQSAHGLDFFERTRICSITGDSYSIEEVLKAIETGSIKDKTQVRRTYFNSKEDFEKEPCTELRKTWFAQHLPS
ncbi:MAG: hypothetical protein OXB93_02985 [Cytophagales bacterium]|nr:hypothetical protein [Cytophagales bacterium]